MGGGLCGPESVAEMSTDKSSGLPVIATPRSSPGGKVNSPSISDSSTAGKLPSVRTGAQKDSGVSGVVGRAPAFSGCPIAVKLHGTQQGYATKRGRVDWLKAHGITEKSAADNISKSLQPDMDPAAPLYYWQLFALLGPDSVEALIRDFYTRVFADKEDLFFRQAFVQISGVEHHIRTQTLFW